MRAVVSMTSYPKRIKYVSVVLNSLLKQTRVPDEIHLWLAEPEFPSKENDLPIELQELKDRGVFILHWLPKNTYIHKRHEIFRYTDDNDLVFFFDDDLIYPCNIIEDVMNKSEELNHTCIINYNIFHTHWYLGKRMRYMGMKDYATPLNTMWCGHSMIPSELYPNFLLEDFYTAKRDILSPVSEECWLTPWLVWNDVPIVCMDFKWGKEIERGLQRSGARSMFYKIDKETQLTHKDRCLYAVLREYPFLYDKYQKLFSYDK